MARAEHTGLRERKRQETLQRITRAGLKLFASKGYEATTLEDIAAAAEISRRTFFHYFKSKDDILVSLQSGMGEQLAEAVTEGAPDLPPLRAMREAGLRLVSAYAPEELAGIDRLMRSSETVLARKRANYIIEEDNLFRGLVSLWPNESETRLHALAMLAIGAARLSLDAWARDGNTGRIEDYINATFDALEALASP